MICKCIKRCSTNYKKGEYYEYSKDKDAYNHDLYTVWGEDYQDNQFDADDFGKYFREEN